MKTRFSRLLFSFSILSLLLSGGVPHSFAQASQPASGPDRQPPSQPPDHAVYLPLVAAAPFMLRAVAIAAGAYHTCALTAEEGVKCWGSNYTGQLGDGSRTGRLTPVDVAGLSSGVRAIVAGEVHTCALTVNGGVKCWGENGVGQLGDGTMKSRYTPVDVVGLSSGVRAIAAGWGHTCALTGSGGVKCWGWNVNGQLGDGTTNWSKTPVDVARLSSGAAAIAAGEDHTCALTGGGVKCWGWNVSGQLGDGTNTERDTPVDVIGLSSGIAAVSAGADHTCALTEDGGVKCWGDNIRGQLGAGTIAGSYTPVDVAGLSSGVKAIAAGLSHTCALTANGGLKCWGENGNGQIGDGTTNTRYTPVDVAGLTTGLTAIAAGDAHTCALAGGGAIKCWGWNASGQLGTGTITEWLFPVDVSGLSSGMAALSTGVWHTCALTGSGVAKCWGRNLWGQLGDGTFSGNQLTPVDVVGLTSRLAAIAAGRDHTCALTDSGGVKCWGDNKYGQLGIGENDGGPTPVDVVGLSGGAAAIAAGSFYTCALAGSGGVQCWGGNSLGQLGDGTRTNRFTPVDVVGLSSGATAVSTGYRHTCALTESGAVKCWGDNEYGQLGDGTKANRSTPVDVAGLSNGVTAIAAGATHTCALNRQRRRQVLGRQPIRAARRRHERRPVDAGGCDGTLRPGEGHLCRERLCLRIDRQRRRPVLGGEQQRPAWRRHANQPLHAGRSGGIFQPGDSDQRRLPAHLCTDRRRHRPVLGAEQLGPAWERDDRLPADAGGCGRLWRGAGPLNLPRRFQAEGDPTSEGC